MSIKSKDLQSHKIATQLNIYGRFCGEPIKGSFFPLYCISFFYSCFACILYAKQNKFSQKYVKSYIHTLSNVETNNTP